MARRSVLDDYSEELVELKDTLSLTKIADYMLDKHGILVETSSVSSWYKKNNMTKNVKPHNNVVRHGEGRKR